jgi:prepilin-type N-terminal cleavage/methylation domain-containing protein
MRRIIFSGFTIVELLIVIVVVSVVMTSSIISYTSWQHTVSGKAVRSDIQQAITGLEDHKNFKGSYPPNLAGTGFAASSSVAVTLSTNAPSIGVYSNLTPDQQAQLFLNVCNANMFSTPNNTSCTFQGNGGGAKIHVKGTNATNAIWDSPIAESDLSLSCGDQQADCDTALSNIVTQFNAQGGVFPIIVPNSNVALPEPVLTPNGPADRYCIEGRSAEDATITYHALSDDKIIATGQCPYDPTLHYYQ